MWHCLLLFPVLLQLTACVAQTAAYRVTVETPSSCYKLDRVDGERVYLKLHGRVCLPLPGKETLDIDPAIRKVDIYLDNTFWMEQEVTPPPLKGE